VGTEGQTPVTPDLNPVEYLRAWLKRHALANFCPANLDALKTTARAKFKSAQRRPSIIAALLGSSQTLVMSPFTEISIGVERAHTTHQGTHD